MVAVRQSGFIARHREFPARPMGKSLSALSRRARRNSTALVTLRNWAAVGPLAPRKAALRQNAELICWGRSVTGESTMLERREILAGVGTTAIAAVIPGALGAAA